MRKLVTILLISIFFYTSATLYADEIKMEVLNYDSSSKTVTVKVYYDLTSSSTAKIILWGCTRKTSDGGTSCLSLKTVYVTRGSGVKIITTSWSRTTRYAVVS